MEADLVRVTVAALTHGLPAPMRLQAEDAPLRAAFHADTAPEGCSATLGTLARAVHDPAVPRVANPGHLSEPLRSIWPRVELEPGAVVSARFVPFAPAISGRWIDEEIAHAAFMPVDTAPQVPTTLWQGFESDLRLALQTGCANPVTIPRIQGVLRRWAAALPAHQSDEPLLEHLGLSAAVASALWRLNESSSVDSARPFLLVLIDLGGIQRYLFATANTAAGGIARRLRARSLTLALVAEALGHALVRALDLPLTSILATTGGHSYLLLPHTTRTLQTIHQTWRTLERDLWQQYGGVLTATLATYPIGAGDLASAGGALHELARLRAEEKLHPLGHTVRGPDGWQEGAWLSSESFVGRDVCSACGTRPASTTLREGDPVCEACAGDYRLGAILPRSRFLAWLESAGEADPDSSITILPGYAIQAVRELPSIQGASYLIQSLNDFALPPSVLPIAGRYIATHVPIDGEGVARDFGAIARDAQGAPLLAVVKADVDRLGALFAWGLRRDDAGTADTLARSLALSRVVDTFFTGWVQGLLSYGYHNCYTIYSGGDDLLLVGPWDEALRLLATLQKDFRQYTAHPQITLSAGVAIIRSNTPIADAARVADEQEALAKESGPTGGRNQLAIFDQVLSWDRALVLINRWQGLIGSQGRIPGSILHRWLGYAAAYQQHPGAAGLRALTHFAYDFARNSRDLPQDYREEWQRMLSSAMDGRATECMAELAVLARLLLLSQRGRE